jgi:nucleotide-binding universal stress UspA family protein
VAGGDHSPVHDPDDPLPRRILVALVAEDDDQAVVRYASGLAIAFGAGLVLVAVAPFVPVPASPADAWEPAAIPVGQQQITDRLAAERLAEIMSAVPSALERESVLTWGTRGPAIVEAAREHHADLVVVPMRRRNEVGHVLHDNADRYVLHHSDAPVLVVPVGP